MEIEEMRVMAGPNMWAEPHKLVVVKTTATEITETDLEWYFEKAEIYLNKDINVVGIPDDDPQLAFATLLAIMAASLQDCSSHLYCKGIRHGRYVYTVFEYEEEEMGILAAHKTIEIINQLIEGHSCSFKEARQEFKLLKEQFYPGPSTFSIIEAAQRRNIPIRNIAGGKFVMMGHGKYQKRIEASICETTSNISVEIAGNKDTTKHILSEAMVPVPTGMCVQNLEELMNVVEKIKYPLVTKPLDGNQGKGITTNITNYELLVKGFNHAQMYSRKVVVEKFVEGNDYRFLVIGYKLIAAAQRIPACVKGNGIYTIGELIHQINDDPRRGQGHENMLTKIKVDVAMIEFLASSGLTLESIPALGQRVYLKPTANLSTGGTAIDVTDEVHDENRLLAERVAKLIGLNICGIDIMAPVVKTPLTENGGVVLEVNAAPGLRMHIAPSQGKPRNVGDPILELMFPEGSQARIPIVAVTGTNGKTTSTRLMAHITAQQGYHVGFTCTDGIYVNNIQIYKGDCSGAKSAAVVLNDPTVDFAVLECARGGLIRSGLAFDFCDVAIVTNVASDHLGLKDIDTLEDLARVKAVVPKSVHADGYAILNASDELVYKMKDELHCKVALFDLHYTERLARHCAAGGIAAYLDDLKSIVIADGEQKTRVENVMNIPLTMGGKAEFMIENILGVVLATYVKGFDMKKVVASLCEFLPEQVPGRINLFKVNDVNIMIDYVHNPHGFMALGKMLDTIQAIKTGIITGVGDRRDDDIIEVGRIAARIYDKIIIRMDNEERDKTPEQIAGLIVQGLQEVKPKVTYHIIPDSNIALRFAIDQALPGEYVVFSAEKPEETIAYIQELRNHYNQAFISRTG
ncbi:MAG TPA: cyanophycin synthetase [Flavobacteriales bacterium]|nr:cyanophycin synthetase [Flavobacteriales bacterium]